LADWAGFLAECESGFASEPPPTSCAHGEKVFREILQTTSRHFISSGHRKSFTPGLPHDAIPLMNHRNKLRGRDFTNPEIEVLNADITKRISRNNQDKWMSKVESCKPNSQDFWSLLRGLSGKQSFQPSNQSTNHFQ
jgi:hypothetical protein